MYNIKNLTKLKRLNGNNPETMKAFCLNLIEEYYGSRLAQVRICWL